MGGVSKISSFLFFTVNISKTVADTAIRLKLLLMTNMKSHMGFRLAPRSMTLDDLELHKSVWWVFSSMWCTLTYHALLGYLQWVSMLSAIANSGSKMTE